MEIKENEVIDDLQLKGYRIIQSEDGFKFGIDAVLVANFCNVKKGDVGIDLGTGTGIIPIIIAGKSEAKKIYGLEIQEEVEDMARRSISLNALENSIQIVHGDIKNASKVFGKATMDFVVSNPPYFKVNTLKSPKEKKLISRHEILCTLEDLFKASSELLKPNKPFFLIHRPDRLVELIEIPRKYKLEPKEILFVQPKEKKAPNLVLLKYVKSGNPGIKFKDSLIVYDHLGEYSEEINQIYKSEKLGEI